jgi:hypothetical protein
MSSRFFLIAYSLLVCTLGCDEGTSNPTQGSSPATTTATTRQHLEFNGVPHLGYIDYTKQTPLDAIEFARGKRGMIGLKLNDGKKSWLDSESIKSLISLVNDHTPCAQFYSTTSSSISGTGQSIISQEVDFLIRSAETKPFFAGLDSSDFRDREYRRIHDRVKQGRPRGRS